MERFLTYLLRGQIRVWPRVAILFAPGVQAARNEQSTRLSACLSRACLGKPVAFRQNIRKEKRFLARYRTCRPVPLWWSLATSQGSPAN